MSNVSNPAPGTRDFILDVSVSLFAQTGYDGVHAQHRQTRGISAAALYHHFPEQGVPVPGRDGA